MQHFCTIEKLTKEDILKICKIAKLAKLNKIPKFKNKEKICNIFNEASTRTFSSFKVAQENLNMISYDLMGNISSSQKGESIEDTIYVMKQYGIKNFVIRDNQNKFYEDLIDIEGINLINAGDGTNEHPSQALLDIFTLLEYFDFDLTNKKVLFIGDLKNSRVFHSNLQILKLFNVKMYCCCPDEFYESIPDIKRVETITKIIKDIDVICSYRLQFERHTNLYDAKLFNKLYGLNKELLLKASPDLVFTHPGPVNWGIELSSDIKYSSKSLILKQVENGIYIRMAIIAIINKLVEF